MPFQKHKKGLEQYILQARALVAVLPLQKHRAQVKPQTCNCIVHNAQLDLFFLLALFLVQGRSHRCGGCWCWSWFNLAQRLGPAFLPHALRILKQRKVWSVTQFLVAAALGGGFLCRSAASRPAGAAEIAAVDLWTHSCFVGKVFFLILWLPKLLVGHLLNDLFSMMFDAST